MKKSTVEPSPEVTSEQLLELVWRLLGSGIEDGPWRVVTVEGTTTTPDAALVWATGHGIDNGKFVWSERFQPNVAAYHLTSTRRWLIDVPATQGTPSCTEEKKCLKYRIETSGRIRPTRPKPVTCTENTCATAHTYHQEGIYRITALRHSDPPQAFVGYYEVDEVETNLRWQDTFYVDRDLGLPWPRHGNTDDSNPETAAVTWTIKWYAPLGTPLPATHDEPFTAFTVFAE